VSAVPRVDAELVRRGLARSRGQAGELVRAGRVRVDGLPVVKPARAVESSASIEVEPGATDSDVGRGAGKLRGALADLVDRVDGPERRTDTRLDTGLDTRLGTTIVVAGRRVLDVGASTGGFTQVLLQRGASSVVALDVGHGQLAPVVADDPRVEERSGTNVRDVTAAEIRGPFDLVVADLSFISLTLVLPVLATLLHDGSDLVLLVKPQFEVGRERLGADGVVRSEQIRAEAVQNVRTAAERAGLTVRAVVPSRLMGASGNVEFFLWATR
jgi:23S rRNA (cytidine1920-2'-O)/16S rRNA (cytidine1409-2'-O)-methyltransferase